LSDSFSRLFFLAIIPPSPVYDQVHDLKLLFSREYQTSRALNSPPHITVIPPFQIPLQSLPTLEVFFNEKVSFFQSEQVSLNGFGCFRPHVIYINSQISQEFTAARSQLLHQFYDIFPQPRQDTRLYHPHMTVAFKDLSPTMFSKAWPVVRVMGFSSSFTIEELVLLKYESGKWVAFRTFPFAGNRLKPR